MKKLSSISKNDREKLLFDEKTIENRILKLANEITSYYENGNSQLVVVGILRGSILFYSSLIKRIDLPILVDFMAISSYGSSSVSGVVKIVKDLETDVTDKTS